MEAGGNDLVRVRGHVWTVLGRTRHAGCEALRLGGADGDNAGQVRTFLTPFDRVAPVARPAGWRRVRPRRWLHALRRLALDAHPFGGLRTADESRIQLLPYQLEPALAMFRRGATRLLIADDVGLGKTIQAGVILRELSVRLDALRALVVMPASLRDQWRNELLDRFELASVVADAAWLLAAARDLPADVNPWSLPGIYVSSYDFVKRPEVLRPLEDVTWDLVVLDEAHAASPATGRRAAADAIAARSRRVVLLTATPHSGDPAQFDALCRLGGGAERDTPVIFQRSRVDGGSPIRRRTVFLPVQPSAAERRMHRLLERYASRIQRESRPGDPRATLAAIVLRKRALSSAGSLLSSASRRQELLAGASAAPELQRALPLDDEDPLPDDVTDDTLAVPGLSDAGLERRTLSAIVRAAAAAAVRETKTAFLIRFLRRVGEPAIVFTEYRDTLARLSAALEARGVRPLTLHGGMAPEERALTQRAFNAHGTLLLATDAASEGLNLQHRCRIVVHYELPWSPVRLQQRTGRVDRIGQTRPVHEILLVAADTAERLVLAPLARRVSGARGSTAGASRLFGALTESRIAAAVLNHEPIAFGEDDNTPVQDDGERMDLRTEAGAEAQRLLQRRLWRTQSGHPGGTAVVERQRPLTTLRRARPGALSARSIAVFAVALRDSCGQVVHGELVPVALHGQGNEEDARRHLVRTLGERLEHIGDAYRSLAAALRRRERAIATVLPTAARHVVQAGLFDRRALRAADTRARTASALLADAQARIDALTAAEGLTASFDLTATLLIAPRVPR